MKKIKRKFFYLIHWFRKRPLKRQIIISFISFMIVSIIYLVVSFLTVSQPEIILLRLKNSINSEGICHDQCLIQRNFWQTQIINYLKKGNRKLERKIKKYFLDESESEKLRETLIIILQEASGNNQSDYLVDYLDNPTNNPETRAKIIQYSLNDLGSPELANYYFSLIADDQEVIIKKEAIKALSNFKNKKNCFNLTQLEVINNLIFNSTAETSLNHSLILLLADYYDLFPRETKSVLENIYQAKNGLDKISRAFAADILNSKTGKINWSLPEISDSEWSDYFNNQ